jgi:hypothetical protein
VTDDLDQTIDRYRAGLEAEIALLRRLHRLSRGQKEAAAAHDTERAAAVVAERERLMAALVKLEHELKPVRAVLADVRDLALGRDTFERVAAMHRAAEELVAAILACDQETMTGLREAESLRRLTSQALEAGESMLAAYRRVVAPPPGSAGLVDRRG